MTKLKKNKMKTHKGLKKVLNVRQSGSISNQDKVFYIILVRIVLLEHLVRNKELV